MTVVEAGRFVDGLKAAGAGFFADVLVRFPCGCHSADKGVCANDCINELYQKGLTLLPPHSSDGRTAHVATDFPA